MINVTKPYLPPMEEYIKYLEKIWASNQLTNNGPLVRELETKLKKYLGVKHLYFVSNGTIALQIAIKALSLKGDIITTPFSFVATTSSIVWEGCNPSFVDINKDTLCLDPDLIEEAITPDTVAILATHVYGYPCDVEAIDEIARRNNLKVIFDAAHAFGVNYKGTSILNYGDLSTLSFHATKLFHTVEGGAMVTNDDELAHRIEYMRNFGYDSSGEFWGLGINCKNSEFHAAMGLCLLPVVDELIGKRKRVADIYDKLMKNVDLTRPASVVEATRNYAYYPILFPSEKRLLDVQKLLNENDINPRRYFYPALNQLQYVQGKSLTVAEDIASRVLCLPLYDELSEEDTNLICHCITSIF